MVSKKAKKSDGRTSDLSFSWMLATLGPELQQWQKLAAEWMGKQHASIDEKKLALINFFAVYMPEFAPYATDVTLFFSGYNGHICSGEEIHLSAKRTITDAAHLQRMVNVPCDFIDFVIKHHFSAEDDNGVLTPLFQNPLSRIKRGFSRTETVRNPLPYRYIQDLRQIVCPLPNKAEMSIIEQNLKEGEFIQPAYYYRHFKDWEWAQQKTREGKPYTLTADWFEVELGLIDKKDPDCVWRKREVRRNGQMLIIHEVWSPVRAMVIFIKLHLPLRTYQVRMLDSGEADTWRYKSGQWELNNKHDFALGSKNRPFGKGVFRRIYDSMTGNYSTGLYINTNKTADNNKDDLE